MSRPTAPTRITVHAEPSAHLKDELSRRLLALATSFDVIWEWNVTTGRVEWSDSMWSLFGYRRDEGCEQIAFWRDNVHPEDVERVEGPRMEATKGPDGTMWEAEYRFRRADGGWAWVVDRGRVYRKSEGEVWMVGALRDVTESREALQRLSASEARYRALVESGSNAVWRVDPQGRFLEPAQYICELLGISREEALRPDFDWLQFLHPEDREAVVREWTRCLGSGEPYEMSQRLRCRDGAWRWHVVRAAAVRDGRGRIVEWVGTHRDISAQKAAEQLLRKVAEKAQDDRQRLQRIVDGLPVAVILADRETGEILYTSRLAREQTRELIGSEDAGQFDHEVEILDASGRVLPFENWPLQRVRRGEVVMGEEVTYRTPRHTLIALVDGLVLPERDGRDTVMMCYRNITRRKQIEAELRSANEAKDRFLAVLSHELRTPLTPVLTGLQMLEADASLPADARETLGVIRRNVELEARLIDDLLDLTRISRGKLRMERRGLDLTTLVSNVLDICRADVRAKGLRLEFVTPAEGGAVMVSGDAARLHQVFWNLLKNAVKFTPEGGVVRVSVGTERAEGEAGEAVVTVSDTGIGIPAGLLPRVFDAFMQGDHDARRYGGLGLGLAIARALIELHGGKLTASSGGDRQGATFEARLPLCPRQEKSGVEAVPEPSGSVVSLRILLVEDHADTARVLQRLLRHYGHHVTVEKTVAGALSVLRAGERFDLMISDIGLPDGSGYDLMRQSAGMRPPAIALSGFGMDDDIRRSREVGFVEHLTKPIDAAHLEQVVLRVGAGRGGPGGKGGAGGGGAATA